MNKILVFIVFAGAVTAQYDSSRDSQYDGGYSAGSGSVPASYSSVNRALSRSSTGYSSRGAQNTVGGRTGFGGYQQQNAGGYSNGNIYGGRGQNGYGNGDESLSEPAMYEFRYDVLVPEEALEFGHQEQRNGDDTTGSYYVLLPDGRRQLVEYTADKDGYKPRISYVDVANSAGGNGGYGSGDNSGARGYGNEASTGGRNSYANGIRGSGSYSGLNGRNNFERNYVSNAFQAGSTAY